MKKLILLSALLTGLCFANSSVYSGFGFGMPLNSVSVRSIGIGQAAFAAHDSIALNAQNPSQWYGFHTTSLEGRFISSLVDNPSLSQTVSAANITGFTVKVPTTEYAGIAFGLLPVTRVNFMTEYSQSIISDHDTVDNIAEYNITGGITEFFAGAGYRVTRQLSLGLKSRFLFGVYDKMLQIDISDDDSYNAIYEDRYELKGVRFGLGAAWRDKEDDLCLSAYFEQGFGLNYSVIMNYYYTPNNYYYMPDTTVAEGELEYPFQFMTGFSKKLSPNVRVYGEFDFQHVNKTDYSGIILYKIVNGADGYKISMGLERTPERFLGNYLGHLSYRWGAYYRKYPYETDLTETGGSIGLGVPFNNYLSRVDIALSYAYRKSSFNFGNEEVISLNMSVTTGGKWFRAFRRY